MRTITISSTKYKTKFIEEDPWFGYFPIPNEDNIKRISFYLDQFQRFPKGWDGRDDGYSGPLTKGVRSTVEKFINKLGESKLTFCQYIDYFFDGAVRLVFRHPQRLEYVLYVNIDYCSMDFWLEFGSETIDFCGIPTNNFFPIEDTNPKWNRFYKALSIINY